MAAAATFFATEEIVRAVTIQVVLFRLSFVPVRWYLPPPRLSHSRRRCIQRLIAAKRLAQALSISSVTARCLPETKLEVIGNEQRQGRRIMMVKDGVNDAPALKGAMLRHSRRRHRNGGRAHCRNSASDRTVPEDDARHWHQSCNSHGNQLHCGNPHLGRPDGADDRRIDSQRRIRAGHFCTRPPRCTSK